jgi:hypothetical protein
MNPTIRNLPGHAFAPGYQPQGPSALETGVDRVTGVLWDLTDFAMPFLVALSGALLVWVLVETMRARARRRRAAVPLVWEKPVSPKLDAVARDRAAARRRGAAGSAALQPGVPGAGASQPAAPAPRRTRGREPFSRESLQL